MRVSTLPLHAALSNAIQSNLSKAEALQRQLASGKRVNDHADLGPESARIVSIRSVAAREEAYAAASKRTAGTLQVYDAHLGQLHAVATRLRETLLTAVGTGNGHAVPSELEQAFAQVRSSLNAREGGVPLFAGTSGEAEALVTGSLAELVTVGSTTAAFGNDEGRASVVLADGRTLTFGIHADEAAEGLVEALRIAADASIPAGRLSDTDIGRLRDALDSLDVGLTQLSGARAANGRRQVEVDAAEQAARSRLDLMTKLVGEVEDADYAKVAAQLVATQTALQASLSVFAQMRELTLANYLR